MTRGRFEWDPGKDRENAVKHGVSFSVAQEAFLDPFRVIIRDVGHGGTENRWYCMGYAIKGIITVRFTVRGDVIRIIGAGYWRKGKRIYEEENGIR